MATKADFTESEWQVLKWAMSNTIAYLSLADKGFWDTFKEATGAAKYVMAARNESPSLLVRDLAADVKTSRDKEVAEDPTNMAAEVAERLTEAAGIVAEKAPDELEAFKAFVIGLAEATAEAAGGGIGETEASALDRVRVALT